jgi:hypothetical protein
LRPSVAIVAFAADRPLTPRGERALAIAEAVSRTGDVELFAPSGHVAARGQLRKVLRAGSPFLLDKWEAEAWWTMRRRRIRPDGALLVGFPFSPLYWAARWLVRDGVRYVVDVGDPWSLTLPPGERPDMGRLRANRAERFVWRSASAGVVTTELQANGLRELFPQLPVIVRPNGYRELQPARSTSTRPAGARTLRLVHYGNLYEPRLDIAGLLGRLVESGVWDSVVFTQQGDDWTGALRRLPPTVRVDIRKPVPWHDVVVSAPEHDLAVVVGNRNPAQLPSKAVQYLTLPIPRLAVVGHDSTDALADYVRDKPGWLTLPWDASADLAGRAVASHVGQRWSVERLAAPESESWEAVADTLARLLLTHTVGQT